MALVALIAAGTARAAGAASAGNGKAAYVKNGCWQCHGFVGQGGPARPKLAPDPLPLAALAAFIRNTNGRMPPYMEAVLSNADLADIHAYLLAIPQPAGYNSIPLLRQAFNRGRVRRRSARQSAARGWRTRAQTGIEPSDIRSAG